MLMSIDGQRVPQCLASGDHLSELNYKVVITFVQCKFQNKTTHIQVFDKYQCGKVQSTYYYLSVPGWAGGR